MTVPALTYSEYPKWLSHKKLNPVIIYDEDQEKEHLAKGYFAAGSSDPHGYLVAKATEKMDDAIRTMNADVENKVKQGLDNLYLKLSSIIKYEIKYALEVAGVKSSSISVTDDYGDEIEEDDLPSIETLKKDFAADIMDIIRSSAKGTN